MNKRLVILMLLGLMSTTEAVKITTDTEQDPNV